MGSIHPFRRLRRGPPSKLPTPGFLRVRRPRKARLRPFFGFLALALMMGAGAYTIGLRQAPEVLRSLAGTGVTVVDGDSLRDGHENIRLLGIDAPELRQTCRDERGQPWPCGRVAHTQLQSLLARGEVRCTSSSHDRYGRTLATCSAGDVADVGEMQVRAGYAVDNSRALGTYRSAEAEARAARRGIWRGTFERPQDWRRSHPRAD